MRNTVSVPIEGCIDGLDSMESIITFIEYVHAPLRVSKSVYLNWNVYM